MEAHSRLIELRNRERELLLRFRSEWLPKCAACTDKTGFCWGRVAGCPQCTSTGHVGTLTRGFLEEVKVPNIASVMVRDAVCPGCRGRGGWEDGEEGQWVTCNCDRNRKWLRTPYATELLERFPTVQRVVPVDRMPNMTEYGWAWNRNTSHHGSTDGIPSIIFDAMNLERIGNYKVDDMIDIAISILGTTIRKVLDDLQRQT
jgi:hypothetical protein